MSKMVTIPSNTRPYWECCINGVPHSYMAGSTQEVPDEVASLIEHLMEQQPKEPVKAEYVDYDMVIRCSTNLHVGVTAAAFAVESGDAEALMAKIEKGQMPQVRVHSQQEYSGGIYFDDAIAHRVSIAGSNIGLTGVCHAGRWNMTINKDTLAIRSAAVTEWYSGDNT